MSEKTATQVSQERYERALDQLKKERFWQHPETLPEAIAKHYCSVATIALQLAQLVAKQREFGWNHEVDYLIRTICKLIMDAHRLDFGSRIVEGEPIYPVHNPEQNPPLTLNK